MKIGKFLNEDQDKKYVQNYEKRRDELLNARCSDESDEITKLYFGCHVYSLRRSKGFDQAEFGEMIGLTRESVNRIENGKQLPHRKTITKIADVLNTKEEKLFERAKIPYKTKFPVYDKKKFAKILLIVLTKRKI